jgi:hypothetical protein
LRRSLCSCAMGAAPKPPSSEPTRTPIWRF